MRSIRKAHANSGVKRTFIKRIELQGIQKSAETFPNDSTPLAFIGGHDITTEWIFSNTTWQPQHHTCFPFTFSQELRSNTYPFRYLCYALDSQWPASELFNHMGLTFFTPKPPDHQGKDYIWLLFVDFLKDLYQGIYASTCLLQVSILTSKKTHLLHTKC